MVFEETLPETKAIKAALLAEEKAGHLVWGGYRIQDINDSIWLSRIFKTRVMIAYFDDDESDTISVSHCGKLERVCIMGAPINEQVNLNEEALLYHEIRMDEQGDISRHSVEPEGWNYIFEREFKQYFGHAAPELTDLDRTEFDVIDEMKAKPAGWSRIYDWHRALINILFLPVLAVALVCSIVKRKFSIMQMALGAFMLLAIFTVLLTDKSGEDSALYEGQDRPKIEELCAGKHNELTVTVQEFCKRMEEIKRKKNDNSNE